MEEDREGRMAWSIVGGGKRMSSLESSLVSPVDDVAVLTWALGLEGGDGFSCRWRRLNGEVGSTRLLGETEVLETDCMRIECCTGK